jgi:hypothetical protein
LTGEEQEIQPQKNQFYSKIVLDTLQDIYIAYFPFFASAVPATRIKGFTRSTNATVESYFGVLKTLIQ